MNPTLHALLGQSVVVHRREGHGQFIGVLAHFTVTSDGAILAINLERGNGGVVIPWHMVADISLVSA